MVGLPLRVGLLLYHKLVNERRAAIDDGKIRFVSIEVSRGFSQSEIKGFEVPCITSHAEIILFTNGKLGPDDCKPGVGAQLSFLSIPEQYDLMGVHLPSVFERNATC